MGQKRHKKRKNNQVFRKQKNSKIFFLRARSFFMDPHGSHKIGRSMGDVHPCKKRTPTFFLIFKQNPWIPHPAQTRISSWIHGRAMDSKIHDPMDFQIHGKIHQKKRTSS